MEGVGEGDKEQAKEKDREGWEEEGRKEGGRKEGGVGEKRGREAGTEAHLPGMRSFDKNPRNWKEGY